MADRQLVIDTRANGFGLRRSLRRRSPRLLLVALVALLAPARARADEVAPALEGADLRTKASAELRVLVALLPKAEQQRLTGVYVAFDPDASDPFAQVACDDDGDPVVLVSDAMLRVASFVARAAISGGSGPDEATRTVEALASFMSQSSRRGRRLLPPPPGFYADAPEATSDAYEERLGDALAFLLARELAHLRRAELVCPHPTATRESGDDVWTIVEQRAARATAATVYRPQPLERQLERERDALGLVLAAGHAPDGALAVPRFFAAITRVTPEPFAATYTWTHPNAAARLASLVDIARDIAARPPQEAPGSLRP